jgi:hypothetical protein
MIFTNTTVKEFIDYIIIFDNIDEILEKAILIYSYLKIFFY